MQRQKDSVNLMTFIKPHQSGFLLSIILAVISVTSGIVPYFAVARIVNLLIGGETNFSAYLTWGIVALIAYLMKSVFHGFSTRCSHEATFHVLSEIRQAIADKLTRVSMGYLTDTPSGRLKTTMVERVEQMEVPLAHIIPEMTSMPQTIISTVPTFMQMMGMCMAGSAIVENIFSLPGLGYRIVNSLTNRDLPVIYATVLFLAFALVIFNILADIIQRLLQTRKGGL